MHPGPILLIVLGLILGPGYYLYVEHVSGRPAGSFTLTERADRWTLPDGTIQRFRGGLAYRPVPLDLHPSRNRVRFTLVFEAIGTADGVNEYQVSLYDIDFPVLERTLTVPGGGERKSVVFEPIEVRSPGEHVFILEEVGPATVEIGSVTLRVREGVERLVMPLAWLGTALLLGGIGWLTYSATSGGRRGMLKFRALHPLSFDDSRGDA